MKYFQGDELAGVDQWSGLYDRQFSVHLLHFWSCEKLQADSVKIANVAHLQQWVEVFLCFIVDMMLRTQNNMKFRLQTHDKTQIL